MMADWLKSLGVSLQDVANGLLAIIIGMVVWFGKRSGSKPEAAPHVELAGAVIDNRKANDLVRGFERTAEALDDNTEASRSTAAGIAAIGAEVRAVRDEIRESNLRLEGIKDELIRIERMRR